MSLRILRITALVLLSLSMAAPRMAAQRRDNSDRDPHVTLISAKSAELLERGGQSFRKVTGPARFFHNNTYLLCDTAWWNVNTNVIRAIGHVKIQQDRTTITSETLEYVVDEDMAKFRGLVQLEDQDHNILRTRYLDYNTKDSVAVFQGGASMKDKDGQVIESLFGTYEAKLSLFVFNDQVNMFSDSIFVKTSRLEYRSDINTAYFGYGTDAWESDRMLSANDGWYDRAREIFFFRRRVHMLTKEQEAWSDSLFYHRTTNDLEMLGNVELIDTTRNVYALAGRLEYADSSSMVRLMRDPAVVSMSEDGEKRDTVYIGADTLMYFSVPRCMVDSMEVVHAQRRLTDLEGDPITEYRRKAAEEARKAAEAAAAEDPNRPPVASGRRPGAGAAATASASVETPPELPPADTLTTPADTLAVPPDSLMTSPADSLMSMADSLGVTPPADSLDVTPPADSLAPPPAPRDSTKIGFIRGFRNVKMFRSDLQFVSDSLAFSELDSLIRLYHDPIVYNEENKQYAADSIFVVVHGNAVEKASLMSNAFITTCEDSLARAYNQIRGAEMIAYFDSTAALKRFDALGGASALFFLEENGSLATVNKVEAKMLYATFKDGELQRITYFEDAKNDAYPVVQLPKDERELKGFRWDPQKRPSGPEDITSLKPRGSERTSYLARPHPEYTQTNRYFPGYINKIYKEIALRDSLAVARAREVPPEKDEADAAGEDSGTAGDDTSEEIIDDGEDIVAGDDTGGGDNGGAGARSDDSGSGVTTGEEPGKQMTACEKRRAERMARREARWAEQDRRYAERQAAKEQKRLERERARKLRALKRLERREQREKRILERYLSREQARAARQSTTR